MTEKKISAGMLKYVSLVTLTIQNSAVALSMRYARTRVGDMFIASTAVVMAEFVKLLASLFLVYQEEMSLREVISTLHSQVWMQKLDTLKVCVPSFIYLIQNNLLYVSASNLDAATYQVSYQIKILTTAMFAVLILHKKLYKTQWIALIFLTMGVALVQLSSTAPASSSADLSKQNRLLGFIAALLACCCSGFAGIYFEKILKGSSVSVWVRNVQLSFLSLPLGVLTSFASNWEDLIEKGFFFGYDAYVAYLVVLNAVGGLLVALVVKFADNILKGFATSLAIVISTVASMLLFDFVLTSQFFCGALLVMFSIFMYSYEPKSKLRDSDIEKA